MIDAATPVGEDINKLFVGSLQTEFGPDRFTVERTEARDGYLNEQLDSRLACIPVSGLRKA